MKLIDNCDLVEYGIHTEKSDLRAHVCVIAEHVFVYPTIEGVGIAETGKYPHVTVPSFINGKFVDTARGYLVPPKEIPKCRTIPIPQDILTNARFENRDNTAVKGEKAVHVVQQLIRHGLFPIDIKPEIVQDAEMQIEGTDILVDMQVRIQVKCDYRGGPKSFGGTGNLFLQTHECNPLKSH